MRLELSDLSGAIGIGVAGNFAGHLEQAGEAGDFARVDAPAGAPRGIFPFSIPGSDTFLGTFPLSHDRLARPAGDVNLQIEPEVGLLCDVAYDGDRVTALQPRAVAAFNDCSIRREGAAKISHKKNWGPDSKGVAAEAFGVTDLSPDGPTATLRLASFLRRDGETHAYGVDSALPDYSYYGQTLLDWIVEKLATQLDAGPLEDVGALVRAAGNPSAMLIGIGATRYTPFGESTFLEPGDESIVVVYDSAAHAPDALAEAVAAGSESALDAVSVLAQRVYAVA